MRSNFVFDLHSTVPLACGPGSSVGIATDYELDGSGSNPDGDEVFRPSKPTPGPTQPPVKWVKGPGGKVRPGRAADNSPPSNAADMKEYSYTSTHPLRHTGSLYLYLYLQYLLVWISAEAC